MQYDRSYHQIIRFNGLVEVTSGSAIWRAMATFIVQEEAEDS